MAFLSNFLEFWQVSFGLSIKSTHEIEWSKLLDEMEQRKSEKNQVSGSEWQMVFYLFTFNSRADMTK